MKRVRVILVFVGISLGLFSQNFSNDLVKAFEFYEKNQNYSIEVLYCSYSTTSSNADTLKMYITRQDSNYILQMPHARFVQNNNSIVGIYKETRLLTYTEKGNVLDNLFNNLKLLQKDSLNKFIQQHIIYMGLDDNNKVYEISLPDSYIKKAKYKFDSETGLMKLYEITFNNEYVSAYSKLKIELRFIQTLHYTPQDYLLSNYITHQGKEITPVKAYTNYELQKLESR